MCPGSLPPPWCSSLAATNRTGLSSSAYAAWDRQLLGDAHIYGAGAPGYDPEGIATTVVATALVLCGYLAGRRLAAATPRTLPAVATPPPQYWSDLVIHRTLTTSQVAGHFYASAEYFTNAGGTVEAWLEDLYAKLLARPADDGGKAYWAGVAEAKGRPAAATAFYQSRDAPCPGVCAL